jgi:hypothetical protein
MAKRDRSAPIPGPSPGTPPGAESSARRAAGANTGPGPGTPPGAESNARRAAGANTGPGPGTPAVTGSDRIAFCERCETLVTLEDARERRTNTGVLYLEGRCPTCSSSLVTIAAASP